MSSPSDEAFCTCGHHKGFVQVPDETDEWFVCSSCLKPTWMYLQRAFEDSMAGG